MKKPFLKLPDVLKKTSQDKERVKKLRFSGCQEDFVITEQEEREGGFFGGLNFKLLSRLK
jgi:hypothetical protein